MKPLQTLSLALALLFTIIKGIAQPIPVEGFAVHQAYRYQHSFSGKIDDLFGVSHSSSLLEIYQENETEIMSQTYATITVSNSLKLGLGTFYASVPGFSPSLNLQFAQKKADWLLLIVPRIDLTEKPAYDLMMLFEYSPSLNPKIKLYSRIQTMESYNGLKHNRGYCHFRLGVHLKKIQLGLAAGLESYGKKYEYKDNYGLFIRTEI